MPRETTPTPFKGPLEDPEHISCAWYWADNAGGHTFDFGQYIDQHQRLRDTSLRYILFCRKPEFFVASDRYTEGLEASLQDDYGRFIVPFGKKHRGKMIEECRDKRWFLWSQKNTRLTNRHPLYFKAVQQWLDHPNHHMAVRDVGELCDPREYERDVAEYLDEDEEDKLSKLEEEEMEADRRFIVNSVENSQVSIEDELDILDAKAERVWNESSEDDSYPGSTQDTQGRKITRRNTGKRARVLWSALSDAEEEITQMTPQPGRLKRRASTESEEEDVGPKSLHKRGKFPMNNSGDRSEPTAVNDATPAAAIVGAGDHSSASEKQE
ncbi:hypothetical protein FIBSPDRAFT_903403 [Athelia psychrophila]|uniref:Uncharacterized protein n=1 Tax=Athelia psychrophila TaxID=1759441 RepID=A0A167W1Y0_9AGAM|nr:hypothetical protein FIBSPDRAFT_903403 [Fibularhizoctonia sp. CBS 109695]